MGATPSTASTLAPGKPALRSFSNGDWDRLANEVRAAPAPRRGVYLDPPTSSSSTEPAHVSAPPPHQFAMAVVCSPLQHPDVKVHAQALGIPVPGARATLDATMTSPAHGLLLQQLHVTDIMTHREAGQWFAKGHYKCVASAPVGQASGTNSEAAEVPVAIDHLVSTPYDWNSPHGFGLRVFSRPEYLVNSLLHRDPEKKQVGFGHESWLSVRGKDWRSLPKPPGARDSSTCPQSALRLHDVWDVRCSLFATGAPAKGPFGNSQAFETDFASSTASPPGACTC